MVERASEVRSATCGARRPDVGRYRAVLEIDGAFGLDLGFAHLQTMREQSSRDDR